MLALEKNLKKPFLQRILHNKEAISAGCVAVANIIPICLLDNEIIQLLSSLVIGLEINEIIKCWLREKRPESEQIVEVLKKSQTYIDCKSEYNYYIEAVAKLIKKIGLTSSKESIMYLQFLLENGFFSKNMKHRYYDFKEEKDYLVDLFGAKVLTGTSVCRHMSSFERDVMNELGYTSANASVTTTTKNPIELIQKGEVKWDHSVTAITENGLMYLFDPTCGLFSALPKDIPYEESSCPKISQFVTSGITKYILIDPNSVILNPENEKELQKIFASRQAKINTIEYEYLIKKADLIYHGNMYNQFSFHQEQEERRAKIEHLYQELCPYSDSPIKKWVVRR